MTVLAWIVRAREALEVGEPELAARILAQVEHELAPRNARRRKIVCCPCCGLRFRWPGELAQHQDTTTHKPGTCP